MTLQGSANDANGSITSIQWTQLSGPNVTLQATDTLHATFLVPWYTSQLKPMTFQLSVTDSDGLISSDTVTVTVTPDWALMNVQNEAEVGRLAETNSPGDRCFIELEMNPLVTYDIILREFIGKSSLRIYASKSLSQSQLIAQSNNPDATRHVITLPPTGLNKVYLEISSRNGNQFSLSARIRNVYLEPGFPADTQIVGGTHATGAPTRAVAVGNIDGDPELEIVVSGQAAGPLYAFNFDGSPVNGWPVSLSDSTGYPSIGELNGDPFQMEIAAGSGPFLGSCVMDRFLFDGSGTVMAGWPQMSCHAGTITPPMLADINQDGIDEVFFEDGTIVRSDGINLTAPSGSSGFGQPVFGDITGDGIPELVYNGGNGGQSVVAYFLDGTLVPGFPVNTDLSPLNMLSNGPLGLADLDGDGAKEIIQIQSLQDNPSHFIIQAVKGNGTVLWKRETLDGRAWGTVPSFGDLNGDGVPELLIQTDEKIYAWDGSGTLLPNFPISYFADMSVGVWAPGVTGFAGSSTPLIADVTGDKLPDIIVAGANNVGVYSATGVLEHKIPIVDNHVMFGVADIDLDGRNEIIVAEDVWYGVSFEEVGSLFIYDLGGANHGPVQWGQLGGNSRHHYSYPPEN